MHMDWKHLLQAEKLNLPRANIFISNTCNLDIWHLSEKKAAFRDFTWKGFMQRTEDIFFKSLSTSRHLTDSTGHSSRCGRTNNANRWRCQSSDEAICYENIFSLSFWQTVHNYFSANQSSFRFLTEIIYPLAVAHWIAADFIPDRLNGGQTDTIKRMDIPTGATSGIVLSNKARWPPLRIFLSGWEISTYQDGNNSFWCASGVSRRLKCKHKKGRFWKMYYALLPFLWGNGILYCVQFIACLLVNCCLPRALICSSFMDLKY